MSYKATKPGLVSVLYLSMRYTVLFIRTPFCVSLVFVATCSVFLVVLVNLSVLAKWLARKTPLKKPNRGEGIVSRKPRQKSAYDFLGLLYCFIVLLCICVVSCPYMIRFPTFMALYSLFVLKVSLNPKQANKQKSQKSCKRLSVTRLERGWHTVVAVTSTFVTWLTLSFNEIQNWDILVPSNPGTRGKGLLKWRESVSDGIGMLTVPGWLWQITSVPSWKRTSEPLKKSRSTWRLCDHTHCCRCGSWRVWRWSAENDCLTTGEFCIALLAFCCPYEDCSLWRGTVSHNFLHMNFEQIGVSSFIWRYFITTHFSFLSIVYARYGRQW